MNVPPDIPPELSQLDDFLADREAAHDLKPGTEAHIRWQKGQEHHQTDYALVYLHGFRASHPEGHPVHRKIADFLGANLYLSRLQEHGIQSSDPLRNLTEEKLLASARFALAVGEKIGRKVILMGTSTGGSLSLYLAAQPAFKKNIAGMVLYSPLIRFFGMKEKLLQYGISRRILGCIPGKSHLVRTLRTTYAEDRIWYPSYALQGALELGAFVDHYMRPPHFHQIECPVFVGYFYKNRWEQDDVVSVAAIQGMIDHLKTNAQKVYTANFPNAENHVICNYLVSKSVEKVIQETQIFFESIDLHGNK
ncbi:Uncharacterised protein family (UPF0227) [Fodinibius roseus]|uniref:Uncharacterized protein family (UPF0227) n=1 Tax=Fodinibius roseus TaxID=1194090 RepID=A0A1M5GJ24_9BACT|nr:alpha/beta hydrolase [Fodinibius roseus]SHG03708.1 Uncharacterised protein family (UPF0227) [Fodinibius roseus]